MKFYSVWQPLKNEDAHTALVFGFLRHAPPELALRPWLKEIVGGEVVAGPLAPGEFWPRYPSSVDEHKATEPDLAFPVDGGNSWVIIEAKPLYKQHEPGQLGREVVDTVRATGAKRATVIMVGADLGVPRAYEAFETEVRQRLGAHDVGPIELQLAYSSWAQLGAHVEACGHAAPEWRTYSDDVLEQLKTKALLGYNGLDVFEGLEEVNAATVVAGYNRVVLAARQFFLTLHDSTRFQALGMRPPGSKDFEMLRDDPSTVLTQYEDWFTTWTLLAPYRHPDWSDGQGAFAGFFFDDEGAYLVAGAFIAPSMSDFAVTFSESADVKVNELQNPSLRDAVASELDGASVGRKNEFRYGSRTWSDSTPKDDIEWTLGCLAQAHRVWRS